MVLSTNIISWCHSYHPKQRRLHQQQQHRPARRRTLMVSIFVFVLVLLLFSALTHIVSFLRFETFLQFDGEWHQQQQQHQQHVSENQDNRQWESPRVRSSSSSSSIDWTTTTTTSTTERERSQSINNQGEEITHSIDNNIKSESEEEDMYFRDPYAAVVDWHYFPPLKREPARDASWIEAASALALPPLEKKECDRFMETVDTSPPPQRTPSDKACEGYDGILHIHHFDKGAASGTAFFVFTIGMLAWADQHNYLPWVHIEDGYTKPIWDPIVHTTTNYNNISGTTFQMKTGMDIGWARDIKDTESHIFPGKPFLKRPLHSKEYVVHGTGVWEHYFLPPNDFVPGDTSCRSKPIVKFSDDQIVPGIHANAPWSPRPWRYTEAPYITRHDLSWDQWFEPQRQRAAEITQRYIRFNPMMERRARCTFPNPEFSLGMHIRHGDKYIERDIIDPDRFLVFAEAFVDNGGGSIYLATDSAKVVETILEEWPKHVADHIVHQPSLLGLTRNDTAAFNLGISSHRTNVEALTDVLALSKCTFFLHGLSAMSEAVLYLNPGLVAKSINLEDRRYRRFRPESFVKTIMPLGRKDANEGNN